MAKTCLLLVAGGLAAQHITALPSYDVLCLVLVASLCGLWSERLRPVAVLVLGAILMLLSGTRIVENRLDPLYAGDSMRIRLRIVDFPRRSGDTVTMTAVPLRDPRVPPRIRLSWFEAPVMPRIGETWELELRLRRPRGSFNPGVFDTESWLFREKIHATGYVVAGERNRLLWAGGVTPVDRFRERFVARVRAAAGSPEAAAVLAAIGAGARHLVSREQWEDFARTGTTHLMAISGLHIGLAATAGLALGFAIALVWPSRQNHYVAALAFATVLAGLYALVSGFAVPARRACIMLVATALTVGRRRQVDVPAIIALAAGCVFLTDPVATLTPGFHLSFAAVILLLWLGRRLGGRRRRRGGLVRQLFLMQVFLMFGLLPLTVLIFGRFAPLAAPVNLVAVPVFSLVTVPLTLAAAVLGESSEAVSAMLLRIAGLSVSAVATIIGIASDLPIAATRIAGIEGLAWLYIGMPLIWVVLPYRWPGRHVAILGVVALVTWKPPPPPADCFDAWVLDVGQGLAVTVMTSRAVFQYDTGMAWRSGGTVAEQIILPFLAARGVDRIDRLIVSHADLDHSGGAREILRSADVRDVLVGEPVPGIDAPQCAKGQRWRSGDILFEVLSPSNREFASGNNASCVVRVSAGRYGLLLTGDVEVQAETVLLRAGVNVAAEVVVVPHHGSRTSSSPPLVDAVGAAVAIVSAGYANRWGFPLPEVAGRWELAGATVLTTASNGAVYARICAAGGLVELSTERQRRRRFWHDET